MSGASDRIFLIGYRGTGKTTVGRILAARLGWKFLDADTVLEERFATTIRDIFAAEGEAGFRDKESAILVELSHLPQHVIATGGGVVLRAENRLRLQRGFVVWLTASAGTIEERIAADPSTSSRRPNLTSTGGRAEIERMLAIREPLYRECAHLTIPSESRSPDELVSDILMTSGIGELGT